MAVTVSAFLLGGAASAAERESPVVLELFTSQSCSSCPPADALMKRLSSSDASLLVLSYHVDYWDYLSWKDTYSSPANTERQHGYAQASGSGRVFTPQLIVDGAQSMVGSAEGDVRMAIEQAKGHALPLALALTPRDGKLELSGSGDAARSAELWEIRYDAFARTDVKAGENGGRMLESIHNVTGITRLGDWKPQGEAFPLLAMPSPGDGVAVLAQAPGRGKLLGATFKTGPLKP